MTADLHAFVRANTVPARAPLVPEIVLALATEITPIWQATEDYLHRTGIEPPYWAFAWPGAQALARLVLDQPHLVAGRRVLDFAAGCGLAAIACATAGAARVDACELDPLAVAAIALNARVNHVAVHPILGDLVGTTADWDLILCGDVCYEGPMTRRVMPWLRQAAAVGCTVWLADPGRNYLPTAELLPLGIAYDVPTSLELEDRTTRRTAIYEIAGLCPEPAGASRPRPAQQ